MGAVIAQRLLELWFARRNARWIRKQGGFEVEGDHYKWIVLLHVSFFAGMIAEVRAAGLGEYPVWTPGLAVFALAQIGRAWCLFSLGRYWNTRVFVVPGHPPIRRGPYRWLRHPNYLVVMTELVSLPLTFHAVYTALLASMAHMGLMAVRIPVEESALRSGGRTSLRQADREQPSAAGSAPSSTRPGHNEERT